jgi:hypothetical protein
MATNKPKVSNSEKTLMHDSNKDHFNYFINSLQTMNSYGKEIKCTDNQFYRKTYIRYPHSR